MIVDHYGRVVVDMASSEGVAIAEIDIDAVNQFRTKFNVGRDADKFEML
jgi:predicted amidohydrolase